MSSQKEEEKTNNRSCMWIYVLVVVLLFALAYFAIYRDRKTGSPMRGGKWTARGGCACMPPP